MKIAELVNGYYYMITNEQREFFKQLLEGDKQRTDLDERQQRLAEEMTGMGIIDREYDEKTKSVIYKVFTKN